MAPKGSIICRNSDAIFTLVMRAAQNRSIDKSNLIDNRRGCKVHYSCRSIGSTCYWSSGTASPDMYYAGCFVNGTVYCWILVSTRAGSASSMYFLNKGSEKQQRTLVLTLNVKSCAWPPFKIFLCKEKKVLASCHDFLKTAKSSNCNLYPTCIKSWQDG